MNKSNRFLTACLICLAIWLGACQQASHPVADTADEKELLAVQAYRNPAAFDLFYPSAWTHYIVRQGLIVFGEPQTVDQAQPGALLTILRVASHDIHDDARGELGHYLEFGPLRSGYTVKEEIAATTLAGRPAYSVLMALDSAEQGDEALDMYADIIVAETESGAVYIFTATAPQAVWDDHNMSFRAALQSVVFHE